MYVKYFIHFIIWFSMILLLHGISLWKWGILFPLQSQAYIIKSPPLFGGDFIRLIFYSSYSFILLLFSLFFDCQILCQIFYSLHNSLRNLTGSASADFLLNWKCISWLLLNRKCISWLPVKPEVHQLTLLLDRKCISWLLFKPEMLLLTSC